MAVYSVPTIKIVLMPAHPISAPLSSEPQERELDQCVLFGPSGRPAAVAGLGVGVGGRLQITRCQRAG